MTWLPISLLAALTLVLVRLKRRNVPPVAAWPWWFVWTPLWLPVALLFGFGLAWLLLALIVLFVTATGL